jgi:predicted dehydrogenase
MNPAMNRRQFLKVGAGLGLAAVAPGVLRAATVASRRLRIAVAGTNSRGLTHIEALGRIEAIDLAYVCDVDDRALTKGIATAARVNPAWSPKAIKDFRRALEDPTVDAITIATPDHWHTPMAILALAAGKHVYVEKPCSQNGREGELLKQAIARYGRLVQMGNQRRSFPNMQAAVAEIRSGVIGDAYFAKAWYENNRASIGRGTEVAVPKELDYDLWQGPAPRRSYRSNTIPYNWHWFWHWGTGEALNNGTHEVDVCRWALGVDFATQVSSAGGRFAFSDDWETPDTQVINWNFGSGKLLTWEGRSCNPVPTEGLSRGAMVYGTKGAVLLDGNSYTIYDNDKKVVRAVVDAPEGKSNDTRSGSGLRLDTLHVQNFIDAVRTGSALTSPIEEGHKSVALLHLGNISQRVGRTLRCDPANGHVVDDAGAAALWGRTYEPGWEPRV